jgi:hypothetical protein
LWLDYDDLDLFEECRGTRAKVLCAQERMAREYARRIQGDAHCRTPRTMQSGWYARFAGSSKPCSETTCARAERLCLRPSLTDGYTSRFRNCRAKSRLAVPLQNVSRRSEWPTKKRHRKQTEAKSMSLSNLLAPRRQLLLTNLRDKLYVAPCVQGRDIA